MSGAVNEIVEEIVANVYQDGVFVLRNGRHHHITPTQVAERWSELIRNQKAHDSFRDTVRHGERLFAWVQDHQVAFVWMDLDSPPVGRPGSWRAIQTIERAWQPFQATPVAV